MFSPVLRAGLFFIIVLWAVFFNPGFPFVIPTKLVPAKLAHYVSRGERSACQKRTFISLRLYICHYPRSSRPGQWEKGEVTVYSREIFALYLAGVYPVGNNPSVF